MKTDHFLRSKSEPASAEGPPRTGGEIPTGTYSSTIVDPAVGFNRARLYALLAMGLDRPEESSLDCITDGVFTDHLREAAVELGYGDVITAVDSLEQIEVDAGRLRDDWARLFGVEKGITVSPYELTYLPGPLVTNIRQLADIKGFYGAFGFQVADGNNDRGDHVCFELEFMSHIALQQAYLHLDGDTHGVDVCVGAQEAFLVDHAGRWLPRFATEISRNDDGFYSALAAVLREVVAAEIGVFDVDPEAVPDDPAVIEWTESIFGDSGRGCGGCGISPPASE